jgi:hypothetical protein
MRARNHCAPGDKVESYRRIALGPLTRIEDGSKTPRCTNRLCRDA